MNMLTVIVLFFVVPSLSSCVIVRPFYCHDKPIIKYEQLETSDMIVRFTMEGDSREVYNASRKLHCYVDYPLGFMVGPYELDSTGSCAGSPVAADALEEGAQCKLEVTYYSWKYAEENPDKKYQ